MLINRESFGELEKKCADAGVKLTGQRRLVLQVLTGAEDHPSVDALFERARSMDPSISMATVYRTLNLLAELDLIQKRDFKQDFARFEVNAAHHHHLIDLDTGDVIEFQNERLEALKEQIAHELGYDLVDHVLELYGRKREKG